MSIFEIEQGKVKKHGKRKTSPSGLKFGIYSLHCRLLVLLVVGVLRYPAKTQWLDIAILKYEQLVNQVNFTCLS